MPISRLLPKIIQAQLEGCNCTVGAEMIKSGKEFHRLTILFVKKFCLTSNLDLSFKSLREWPLVVAVFKVKM